MLPLVLTFDHRVLDGGDAGRFMQVLTELLQEPEKLLLKMG
jgi:pyruvate dehydrogenase E2 component (dihydrolipoamide acetyltransferase)